MAWACGRREREVLDVADDQVRPERSDARDADLEVGAADVDADHVEAGPEQPFGRPRVAAPAVDDGLPARHVQHRRDRSEERDQVDREVRVPGIEGRAVARTEEHGIVDLALDADFRPLVVRPRIARGIARRREGREGGSQLRRRARERGVEQGSLADGVPQMIRQQLRNAAVDRIPASARAADEQARDEIHVAPAFGRGRSERRARQGGSRAVYRGDGPAGARRPGQG